MARLATSEETEICDRLLSKIRRCHDRNQLRTHYADAEHALEHYGLTLPDGKQVDQTPLFWPQKAIDVFSSRLRPAFFTGPNQDALAALEGVWEDVQLAEVLAIKSALRHGPAFIFTSLGDVGEPEIIASAASALTASADIDMRTRSVRSALEMLTSRTGNLYLPGRVLSFEMRPAGRMVVVEEVTATQRVQCAPYVHGMTIERPFGSSRITRSVMGFTDAAVRTFMRSEVSAEFYSYPRERILGVDAAAFADSPGWVQVIGGVQALPDIHPDDDPNIPDGLRRAEVHTLPQMSMQPFSDQFRLIASQFSGASSIPLSYLGIVQDSNPTSSEAIEAQDVDLVRAVEDQQASLGLGRKMLAANVAALLSPRFDAGSLRGLTPQWRDPRVRSLVEQGQFVAQQVQAGNMQAGTRATLNLLPIDPEAARIIATENERASSGTILDRVLAARTSPTETTA